MCDPPSYILDHPACPAHLFKLTTEAQASFLRLTAVRENMGTYLLDFAYFVFNAPALSLESPFNPVLMGSQTNTIDWGRPPPPQIISESKRHSETSAAAFESTRRDTFNECLTF